MLQVLPPSLSILPVKTSPVFHRLEFRIELHLLDQQRDLIKQIVYLLRCFLVHGANMLFRSNEGREIRKEMPCSSATRIYIYVPNCIFSLTNQFNKNTATVEHTKFKLDPARNNYSVDVDDDGAIQTSLFGANANETMPRAAQRSSLFPFYIS